MRDATNLGWILGPPFFLGVVKIVGDWETSTGKMVSKFSAPRSHRSGGNVKAVAVATPSGELLMGDEVVSVNGL